MTNLNQNGRSMIEMLGVLAIIGVLSVGGIAGYSKAMMKFKTNKTLDQIAMTVTNIRTLYAQQTTYAGLTDKNAFDMGVVDDAMVDDSTKDHPLTNPFANAYGSVLISSAESGAVGTSGGAFVIALTGLPREACVAIATNDWGSGYSSGFLGIATKATAYSITDAVSDLGACNVNASTSNGTVAAVEDDTSTEGNEAHDGFARACNGAGPLTVANAAAGCACTDGPTCSVAFKYY